MYVHIQKLTRYKFEYVQTVEQRLQLLHDFQSNDDKLVSLLPSAAALSDQLIQTQGQQYFLHGDLHHENILKKGDTWVMIDPQGVVGELEYEVGAFVRNPLFELLDYSDLEKLMKARFDLLSSLLQLDRQRIIAWAFVQTVLAACFTEQNNNDVGQRYFIAVAEMIKQFFTF